MTATTDTLLIPIDLGGGLVAKVQVPIPMKPKYRERITKILEVHYPDETEGETTPSR